MSSQITFGRVNADEARIFHDGDHVGDLYLHSDILNAGRHYYIVHLSEDPRGPIRIHDRGTHPRDCCTPRAYTSPMAVMVAVSGSVAWSGLQ